MENKEKSDNKGCLVVFIIGVVISLIYALSTTSSNEFAEMGEGVMVIVGLIISYFVIKSISSRCSNKSNESTGCITSAGAEKKSGCLKLFLVILAVLAVISLIVSTVASSYDVNETVGMFCFVAIFIGIAIYIYSTINN